MATRKKRGVSKKITSSLRTGSEGTRGSSAKSSEMPTGDMHTAPPGGLTEMPAGGEEMRDTRDQQTGTMRAMRGGSMDMGQGAGGQGLMPGEKGSSESGMAGGQQMSADDMSATQGGGGSEMPSGTMGGQSNS